MLNRRSGGSEFNVRTWHLRATWLRGAGSRNSVLDPSSRSRSLDTCRPLLIPLQNRSSTRVSHLLGPGIAAPGRATQEQLSSDVLELLLASRQDDALCKSVALRGTGIRRDTRAQKQQTDISSRRNKATHGGKRSHGTLDAVWNSRDVVEDLGARDEAMTKPSRTPAGGWLSFHGLCSRGPSNRSRRISKRPDLEMV